MSSPWTLYALQICEESQKEHLDLYSLHHHPILLWEDLSHNSSRPLCGMYCCALRIPDETIAYPPHPTPPHTHLRVSKHLFFRVPLRNEFYPLKTKSRVWSRKMMQSCEEKWFSFPFLKKHLFYSIKNGNEWLKMQTQAVSMTPKLWFRMCSRKNYIKSHTWLYGAGKWWTAEKKIYMAAWTELLTFSGLWGMGWKGLIEARACFYIFPL